MRSLIVLAAVLVLIAPLATSGQQYACGEPSDVPTGKSTRALKNLRDRVNLARTRKRRPANPEKKLVKGEVGQRQIGLVDYQGQAKRQASINLRTRTAPDRATSNRPKMHRGGVAQIPTILPEETEATQRASQVRFVDQPLKKPTARTAESQPSDERIAEQVSSRPPQGKVNKRTDKRNLRRRRRPQRDVDPDRGILDPAHKYDGIREALPMAPTINSLIERHPLPNAPNQQVVRSRDNRQMSPEEVAAYVRSRRRSGFRWPWSR